MMEMAVEDNTKKGKAHETAAAELKHIRDVNMDPEDEDSEDNGAVAHAFDEADLVNFEQF